MAQAFVQKGYHIISGGTDNHLMLIDLRSKGVTGKAADAALGLADITVNKNMVPFDTQSALVTSGIRIGASAITSRGFGAADCLKTVEWIDTVIMNHGDQDAINHVRSQVNEYMQQFPLYPNM
jgi:glycine hydroxymethyltransferase